jgi:lipopolysaccharide transport system ATP-binding protein
MNEVVITADGLSKRYRIGLKAEMNKTLANSLASFIASPIRNLRRLRSLWRFSETDEDRGDIIWGLRDVSFQVRRGEVLGVIGRNGAGKSTLLKVLSRITSPTYGRAEIRGGVGALLEVGTGFHPQLTGRENTYLNGAILGMKRAEVDHKFDEIVDFSGVEKFIDTPVKFYSSGMYVRLAFAVAAFLEPEILLIDEVLAVGDVKFRQKCLQKMSQVAREGRTVMLVSHDMPAVKSFCDRALMLELGELVEDGPVDAVVDTYLTTGDVECDQGFIPDGAHRTGSGEARIRRVELLTLAGAPVSELLLGQPFRVELTLEVKKDISDGTLELGISTLDGTRVTTSFSVDHGEPPLKLDKGWHKVGLELSPFLLPRQYTLDVGIGSLGFGGKTMDLVRGTLNFSVLNKAETGGDRHLPTKVRGFVRPPGSWDGPEPTDPIYG